MPARKLPDATSLGSPVSYGRQCVDQDDVDAVVEVLRSDRLTQGDAVQRFEESLARATGAASALATSNGTVALQLAYMALDVGPGTHVLTTANTFLATATAAIQCGADVSFVDIDADSGNLDIDELEARLGGSDPPDVVTVVHFAGLPCDMQRLLDLKRRFGFTLIEDAAHALGAKYVVDGRRWQVGEHPEVDATTLSFHPVKHITTGEGGAVLTNDPRIARAVERLREHGVDRDGAGPSYAPMVALGLNGRMSDINAALGWSQLLKLPDFLAARREIASRYAAELRDFELPNPGSNDREHAWHLFVARTRDGERDQMRAMLSEHGIQTQLHYHPVPLQPWFRARSRHRSYPRAEAHGRCAVSLPMYPALAADDQTFVIEVLNEWRQRTVAA